MSDSLDVKRIVLLTYCFLISVETNENAYLRGDVLMSASKSLNPVL